MPRPAAATARFVKSMSAGLMFGNENAQIETGMRNDNSSAVDHVHSIRSVTKDRRSNGFLESNREELETNSWWALSHITGPLNFPDEMAKSATRNKLILSLPRNISQSASGKVKYDIGKTYPAGKQYLAFPETKEGRGDLNTSTRRRYGADS